MRLLSEHGILILQKNIAGGTLLDYFLIDFENMPISNGTYLEEMHAGDVIIKKPTLRQKMHWIFSFLLIWAI